MTAFYGKMQAIASGLLATFDQGGLALSVATRGAGPPHDPGPTTFADVAFAGAARGVSGQHVDGTLVLATDLQVTMPGTMNPKMADRVSIGGVRHSIVKIIQKPAAGTPVSYLVIVRK